MPGEKMEQGVWNSSVGRRGQVVILYRKIRVRLSAEVTFEGGEGSSHKDTEERTFSMQTP